MDEETKPTEPTGIPMRLLRDLTLRDPKAGICWAVLPKGSTFFAPDKQTMQNLLDGGVAELEE